MATFQEMIGTVIPEKLREIETREQVKILHCVESGSRAWGFESPDSDYDVRFVYVRRPEHYLRLDRPRDVIEWQLDETLDINGWDLQKALRLLHGSNPTLFEWDRSDIVYRSTPEWAGISAAMGRFFSPKAGIYHYLHTARGNLRSYFNGERVKLRKYFYVLRPILACRWILARRTPPPMRFEVLAEACLDRALEPIVAGLLRRKRETLELGTGPRIAALDAYLFASIEELERIVQTLPHEEKGTWEALNGLFLEALHQSWGQPGLTS